jgi:DNA-binding transcriptional ArsR family regulator
MKNDAASQSVFTLTEDDQLTALADPNCQKILERLVVEPRSPQRMAAAFGTKAAKLYYHFHRLEKAGLIRKRSSHRRGRTVENVYEASGSKYAIDPNLRRRFTDRSVYAQALQRTMDEVAALENASSQSGESPPLIFARALVPVSDDRWNELLEFYEEWLKACREDADGHDEEDAAARHAFTVALYPIGDEAGEPAE